jgi:hypothetical protein
MKVGDVPATNIHSAVTGSRPAANDLQIVVALLIARPGKR